MPTDSTAWMLPFLNECITEFHECLKNREIPVDFPDFNKSFPDRLGGKRPQAYEDIKRLARYDFNMWAIVTKRWTHALSLTLKGKQCIEIMSGVGWLAKALDAHGTDIIATDSFVASSKDVVHPVEQLDAMAALSTYADEHHAVIVSYPPENADVTTALLTHWKPGKIMVFVGEIEKHNLIQRHLKVSFTIPIPSWYGVNDACYVGRWV